MGLELVGGGHGQGSADDQGPSDDGAGGGKTLQEQLAEAERSLAGSRQRLAALVDRAAELRRRLTGTGPSESAASADADSSNDGGGPPPRSS